MKRLLIVAGLLFLTGCVPEDTSRTFVKCWTTGSDPNIKKDTVVYSGDTHGGVAVIQAADGRAFMTFKEDGNDQVVLSLKDRVCAIEPL